MKTDVTTRIILEKRSKRKDGLYPVKLRVTFNRYSKYYALGHALSISEFNKVLGKAPRNDHKQIRKELIDFEEKACNYINELPDFSFEDFEKIFLNKGVETNNFFTLLENKIELLKKKGQVKTARSNQNTLTILKLFSGKTSLPIKNVDVRLLEKFEAWMINRGRSITTVGIYCRNIRAVFNDAIADGLARHEDYPFGRRKYQIPTGRSIKKALTKDDLLKIVNYKPKKEIEAFSRDMWVFSYLANGMNFTDIANLTKESITGNFLVFNRSKTIQSTRSNPILIRVFILSQIYEIIARWGNSKDNNSIYLFPILKVGWSADQKAKKVELAIRSVNYHIGKVAKSLGIEKKVTTYTARHTFSTVLKRSGASIEFISESLGHQNISTTRHYLDSFEDDEKRKWSEKLL